ncbi:MAG: dihydropteroate synthase [Acidobacteria bacterium]|nr:dihydropteroate synthase [Acidobacteriota bacterium]
MTTIFRTSKRVITFEDAPLVMGIVNVTPDSFSDGGRYFNRDEAVKHALDLLDEGADILDIGGESTRPGSDPVSLEEEIDRVIPVIRQLSQLTDKPISIDTTKAGVAKLAIENGAEIINDISGFHFDPDIKTVASESGAGTIIMHTLGPPKTMQVEVKYHSLLDDIYNFLLNSAKDLQDIGVDSESIVIDPGIGFGKTPDHNLEILRNLPFFKQMGYPLLIGASKKSFIGAILDQDVQNRTEGTLAVDSVITHLGVDIIRTHDVKRTRRVIKMTKSILDAPVRSINE